MSDLPVTASPVGMLQGKEIPCMLLPLAGFRLLVPTVSVAEMAPMKPIEPLEDSPEWFVGYYEWRDIKVPVISYEAICGEGDVQLSAQGRIAVLNNTGVNDKLPFIAINTQSIPRMSRISEQDIVENEDVPRKSFDLMSVKVGLEEFAIPNVSALEAAYTDIAPS